MDKDKLNGLLALKLIASKNNFTAAANELGISPPAISRMIKELEKRLGVTLLSRTTRSTSLTEAGQRFLEQAGPGLDQVLAAIDNIGTYAKKPSGLLRLNIPRVIYESHLERIINSFTKKFPEVTVEVYFEDEPSDIVAGGFDAGVRLSDILMKDMVAIKLFGPVRFVAAAAPKYFEKIGRPKHPKDLLTHNCIRIRLGNSFIYDRWEFNEKGKDFQVQVKGSLIYNDSTAMMKAGLEGLGIVYAIEESIKDKVKAGKLEIVLNQFAAESAGFYLYYPTQSQVLPKLRTFIDHLKSEMRK